ncbi:MAG: ParB/RepB/Spo0J family partition protein [Parcubacteria group bacterium]|jgi:ParB family chromosome partitioning protein|nr:ParB/RepB/Spo0J family partition protein [Parcubacteria group bacterium]
MSNTSNFYQNSIFWVEVDKIKPNPFQPRREFDEEALRALSDSIKQYGVLQALVVTRKEIIKDDGLVVEYELIAGERRLRASKLAGLLQVPVIIRMGEGEDNRDDLMKLELAIIENVQREDLNPVERAKAFKRLADEFGFKHHQIAQKVGKSRVYVTNTMRILDLPEEMLTSLSEGKINEGHTRPLLMLTDRPEEQKVLFQDIVLQKMSVRDAELAARRIAIERVRKFDASLDPEISDLEEKFTESLGTRVKIEKKDNGGKLMIEFFSNEDLHDILNMLNRDSVLVDDRSPEETKIAEETPILDKLEAEAKEEEDLYSIKNFSV